MSSTPLIAALVLSACNVPMAQIAPGAPTPTLLSVNIKTTDEESENVTEETVFQSNSILPPPVIRLLDVRRNNTQDLISEETWFGTIFHRVILPLQFAFVASGGISLLSKVLSTRR